FSSDLSGQDFAKLIRAGWVPVGLAVGISVGARHDDGQTATATARGAPNAEVDGYTELVHVTRQDARVQLAADVAGMGAEGVVVSAIDLSIHDHGPPSRRSRSTASTIALEPVPAGLREPAWHSGAPTGSCDCRRRRAMPRRPLPARQPARRP